MDDSDVSADKNWDEKRAALFVKAKRAIRRARLTLGHLEVTSSQAPELGTMVIWPFETPDELEVHPVIVQKP